jgi:hypothetical protein
MGTAWARRGMCELALIISIWILFVGKAALQESWIPQAQFCIASGLLNVVVVRDSSQCFYIYVFIETRPLRTS